MSAIADKVIDVLSQRGWCQGNLEDDAGRLCVLGAIIDASNLMGWAWRDAYAFDDLVAAVAREQYPERRSATSWGFNDHPDTTLDEVCGVIEKAGVRHDEVTS